MRKTKLHQPSNMSKPQYRPYKAHRHLPLGGRPAWHQKKLYRKRCALRLAASQVERRNANRAAAEYTRELIERHVSGRLKVAPEHVADNVLRLMRKPPFQQFRDFKRIFDRINKECNLNQQIIPYFISSHPGCHEEDMAELAAITKSLDFHLEQVQDFTPTPMTISTEAWYTGYDPYTLKPVFSARTPEEKLRQRQYFFWYKPEMRRDIERSLRALGRIDLIKKLWGHENNRTTDYRERPKEKKRRPNRGNR